MMFMLGFVLLGLDAADPAVRRRRMLGYPAEQAGLVLMPGGLADHRVACRWSDILLARRDPRYLMIFGLLHLVRGRCSS